MVVPCILGSSLIRAPVRRRRSTYLNLRSCLGDNKVAPPYPNLAPISLQLDDQSHTAPKTSWLGTIFQLFKRGAYMRLHSIIAIATGLSVLGGAASAGEWADQCAERLRADGRDTSGCTCLEERIGANPSLVDEFQQLGQIADPKDRYDAASANAKAAMDACTR
jgi:hypothetical protein